MESPSPTRSDPWLDRWLPLLSERSRPGPVLEIGCGNGDDTATLVAAGLPVIAFDLSPAAVEVARARVPQAQISCQDVRSPFPPEAAELGAVLASLSLHYFSAGETAALVERIGRCLRPGGVLLCRLNSTEDHHFGASGFPSIEANYFLVEGEPKRFFDQASIRELFASGWNLLALEHLVCHKYGPPKALWELVLERQPGSP